MLILFPLDSDIAGSGSVPCLGGLLCIGDEQHRLDHARLSGSPGQSLRLGVLPTHTLVTVSIGGEPGLRNGAGKLNRLFGLDTAVRPAIQAARPPASGNLPVFRPVGSDLFGAPCGLRLSAALPFHYQPIAASAGDCATAAPASIPDALHDPSCSGRAVAVTGGTISLFFAQISRYLLAADAYPSNAGPRLSPGDARCNLGSGSATAPVGQAVDPGSMPDTGAGRLRSVHWIDVDSRLFHAGFHAHCLRPVWSDEPSSHGGPRWRLVDVLSQPPADRRVS